MIQARHFTKKRIFSPMLPVMGFLQLAGRLGYGLPALKWFFRNQEKHEAKKKVFGDYSPTEHDVIVATYSKSGTNWALQICQQLAFHGEAEFGHIHDIVAWPEAPMPGVIPLRDTTPQELSPTGLRVIKTRLSAEYVPFSEKAKYITVIRDPKEVIISGYKFFLGVFGLLDYVPFEQWFDSYFSEDGPGKHWARHTASFWELRERDNVLVMTYNDLQRDSTSRIREIAELMGLSPSEEVFAKVFEKSSFSYMKEHESRFGPPHFPLVKKRAKMLRKGKSGKTGELLSPEQQQKIDDYAQQELASLNSDFPYKAFFL